MKPEEEENLGLLSGKGSSDTESLKSMDKWDDDKFIWHEFELDIINGKRRLCDEIPVIKRNEH